MSDQVPETGDPVVDAACADVADLSQLPLAEHAARLTAAHEQVASVLQHAPLVPASQRAR